MSVVCMSEDVVDANITLIITLGSETQRKHVYDYNKQYDLDGGYLKT